jgi:RNase P subunit RPR2
MIGNQPSIGSKPIGEDIKNMLNTQAKNLMHITDDKVIVCANCQSEYFVAPVRLAKTKMDLKNDVVGLIQETPRAFCYNCKTELPHSSKEIKTKKDFMDLVKESKQ